MNKPRNLDKTTMSTTNHYPIKSYDEYQDLFDNNNNNNNNKQRHSNNPVNMSHHHHHQRHHHQQQAQHHYQHSPQPHQPQTCQFISPRTLKVETIVAPNLDIKPYRRRNIKHQLSSTGKCFLNY
ncbi:unnamed protein product [Schistosoma spindalis]|nr:unnamed protein product [Schistosoma spindale]